MIGTDYIESQIRITHITMDSLMKVLSMYDTPDYSLHSKHLVFLRWKALEQYKAILEMELDMLEGEDE